MEKYIIFRIKQFIIVKILVFSKWICRYNIIQIKIVIGIFL